MLFCIQLLNGLIAFYTSLALTHDTLQSNCLSNDMDSSASEDMLTCETSRNYVDRVETETSSHDKSTALALVPYTEDGRLPHQLSSRDFHLAGHHLHIQQDWGSLGVAAVVWDAAVVLCEYLEKHPQLVMDKDVIELGAGTGLVGIVSAFLGGHVTVTERKEAMSNLRKTVQSNMDDQTNIKLMELDWTEHRSADLKHYDVVLGADIVYIEDTFDDLLETVLKLTGNDSLVLLSCRIRYQRDSSFLDLLRSHLQVKLIFYDTSRDIKIYSATRAVK